MGSASLKMLRTLNVVHLCKYKVVLKNRSSLSSKDGSWASTLRMFLLWVVKSIVSINPW
jgi:hypothetical protein